MLPTVFQSINQQTTKTVHLFLSEPKVEYFRGVEEIEEDDCRRREEEVLSDGVFDGVVVGPSLGQKHSANHQQSPFHVVRHSGVFKQLLVIREITCVL